MGIYYSRNKFIICTFCKGSLVYIGIVHSKISIFSGIRIRNMDCHNTAYLSIAQFNYIQLVFRIYIISEYMYAHTVFSREAVKHILFPRRIYIFLFCIYCRNMFFHSTSYLFFSANECFHTICYKTYRNIYFLSAGLIPYAATYREKERKTRICIFRTIFSMGASDKSCTGEIKAHPEYRQLDLPCAKRFTSWILS